MMAPISYYASIAMLSALAVYFMDSPYQQAFEKSFNTYANLSEIEKITDKSKKESLIAGINADTWQGYFTSFRKIQTYYRRDEFHCAKYYAMEKDTDAINAIKQLKI